MTTKINCADLGVKDCDYTASGEAPIDALEDMLEHLQSQHDLDLPNADFILSGERIKSSEQEVEPGVEVIVKRLREVLQINETESEEQPQPTIGRTTSGQ